MTQKVLGLLLTLALVAASSAVKIPVTIYYESLCPDSARFITQQVYPAVKSELRDYVDIMWVPFGKTTFYTQGSDVLFNCHHGPNECYGNKVHACAIEHIQANSYQTEFTRESLTLDFVNCMMMAGGNFPDNVYPGARCARDNHISTWENIQNCANSTEGSQLLKRQGETTLQFENPLVSVPTVVFKQQHDPQISSAAMTNFLGTACKFIPQPLPKVCSDNGASSMTISTTLFSILGLALLAKLL